MTPVGTLCIMVSMMHTRKSISNVPEDLWQRLRVLAAERNTSISELVVEAIKIYFAGDGPISVIKDEDWLVVSEDQLK